MEPRLIRGSSPPRLHPWYEPRWTADLPGLDGARLGVRCRRLHFPRRLVGLCGPVDQLERRRRLGHRVPAFLASSTFD